jgi:hypothetical protein
MNLTSRPIYTKSPKARPNPAYLAKVRELPCIICQSFGLPQNSPTQAHHVIHQRGSFRKVPDEMSIPLCEGHHQGLMDTSKVAVHHQPSRWQRLYGPDTDWIARTQDAIERMEANTI